MKKLIKSNASQELLRATRIIGRKEGGVVYSDSSHIKIKFYGGNEIPVEFVSFLKRNFSKL